MLRFLVGLFFLLQLQVGQTGVSLYPHNIEIKPGDTVHFYFKNGSPRIRGLIKSLSRYWSEHINLNFEFHNQRIPLLRFPRQVQVLIQFKKMCKDEIGRSGLPYKKHAFYYFTIRLHLHLCLNDFQETKPSSYFIKTVVHEIGHILGLMHEHQHSLSPYTADVSGCYKIENKYYQKKCLIRGEKYPPNRYYETPFDKMSVMIAGGIHSPYGEDPSLLPTLVSKGDIDIVQRLYGPNLNNIHSNSPQSLKSLNLKILREIMEVWKRDEVFQKSNFFFEPFYTMSGFANFRLNNKDWVNLIYFFNTQAFSNACVLDYHQLSENVQEEVRSYFLFYQNFKKKNLYQELSFSSFTERYIIRILKNCHTKKSISENIQWILSDMNAKDFR